MLVGEGPSYRAVVGRRFAWRTRGRGQSRSCLLRDFRLRAQLLRGRPGGSVRTGTTTPGGALSAASQCRILTVWPGAARLCLASPRPHQVSATATYRSGSEQSAGQTRLGGFGWVCLDTDAATCDSCRTTRITASRAPPGGRRRRPIAPRGRGAPRCRRAGWRRPRRSARPGRAWTRRRSRLPVGTTRGARCETWVRRSRPSEAGTRPPARRQRSGPRAAGGLHPSAGGGGGRHPGARSASISRATASISSRSASSPSKAATSAASS